MAYLLWDRLLRGSLKGWRWMFMYNTMCKNKTKQKAEPQAESFCCRHFSFSKHDDDTVDTLHSNWLSDCQRHASAFICSQRYESLSHLFPLSSEYLHWLFFVCLGGGGFRLGSEGSEVKAETRVCRCQIPLVASGPFWKSSWFEALRRREDSKLDKQKQWNQHRHHATMTRQL